MAHVVGWPRTALGGPRSHCTNDLHLVVDYDWIPKGLVELGEDRDPFDLGRHLISHLRSMVVDEHPWRLVAIRPLRK